MRRSCASCDSGLVWSTTCESSPRAKNCSTEVLKAFALISARGGELTVLLPTPADGDATPAKDESSRLLNDRELRKLEPDAKR